MARRFAPILKMAASHHGGEKAVLEKSRNTRAVKNLAKVPADRLLSEMTRCVFNAGFNWKVIEAKWDGFEAAFEGFDPGRLAFFGDEMMSQLVADPRIVRNGQKIKAALENAKFVAEIEAKEGGFGRFLAKWPGEDQTGLLDVLNKRGSRLGGATGQYFLRFIGGRVDRLQPCLRGAGARGRSDEAGSHKQARPCKPAGRHQRVSR